ncbi:MAG TPA: A24 family peptidase [Actinophytocola sp.]|jgi:leader peptidase (prepilin peptidase)/N-methyltransferase|nr:A24 family peptidase [Actinophytocola sp.]
MSLVLLGTTSGAAAGLSGRWLLSHLRRGTEVHCGYLAAAVAALWAVVGWRVASGHLPVWWLPVPLTVTWFAVLLVVVDLRHSRLPDALTLPAYPATLAAITLAAWLSGDWSVLPRAVVGAAVFLALHAAVHALRPRSLGAGDVKLSGSVGAVLAATGWPALTLAALVAAIVTLLLSIAVGPDWHEGVPHGPGLLMATCLFTLFPPISLAVA